MASMIESVKDLAEYMINWGYPRDEAFDLAQEAEIHFPVSKSEVDEYLMDCGLLPEGALL